jgi:predicted nucleic acid-binding protein
MKNVFADADYWIALLNPRDQLHVKARSVSMGLRELRIITSEMVLTEVLAGLASKGAALRQAAVKLVEQLQSNANLNIVPQTSIQFQKALELYRDHQDKNWSLTDCASVLVMEEQGISEALSYDRHFRQAGFIPLLREGS